MRVRSIPTVYAGIEFRSQLEADWAHFFDGSGIRWVYEPGGFDIDGAWYKPDFWLPNLRTFVEVKGILDGPSETKVRRLAVAAADQGILVVIAEAPAGERWAPVDPLRESFAYRDHLRACPDCGEMQFMTGDQCRICRPRLGQTDSRHAWGDHWTTAVDSTEQTEWLRWKEREGN